MPRNNERKIAWEPYLYDRVWVPQQSARQRAVQSRTEALARVRALETAWDLQFPRDYLETVILHGGSAPRPSGFRFGPHPAGRSAVGFLLEIDSPDALDTIAGCHASYEICRVEPRLIPFAVDIADDPIFLDYRIGDDPFPGVAYFTHDFPDSSGRNLFEIAPSFAAFLEMLSDEP